ncbi:MAG: putative PIN family toxin of toxin-antitoxin system [Gammaproteobacteria bacterium]|jgi:putative PIN family toxin of toxin-antitoxin system
MDRHHVVLDTNVLISAILFGGKPREILSQIISGQIDCTLSIDILDELRDVLQRPKFGFTTKQCIQIVEELHRTYNIIATTTKLRVDISDLDDKMILECAVQAKAGYIVSDDSDLTELHPFRKIKILTPSEYLEQSSAK